MTHKRNTISAVSVHFLTIALGFLPAALHAQTFDSRSTGVDGALDLAGTPAGTTVELDPAARGIDLDGDNVFHFTTVRIPADVTLKLRPGKLKPAPVYWLSQGAVEINGVIDLNGDNGHDAAPTAPRVPSTPGPGGYPGGLGQRPGLNNLGGYGPGGSVFNPGSHNYGNEFLRPLVGGSGGSGNNGVGTPLPDHGAGGGAGGGALLIASSVSVSVNGRISANGGSGGKGGADGITIYAWGASGGEIHLLAPSFSGAGRIEVAGGSSIIGFTGGLAGRIRVESYTNTFRGTLTGSSRVVTLSPNVRFLPAPNSVAFVRAVRIHGVDVPLSPTGSFVMPDVTIDTTGAVTVEIEAVNIPLGTAVGLEVHNETRGILSFNSTPLTGTLGNSTATVSINPFPSGFSQVLVRARW